MPKDVHWTMRTVRNQDLALVSCLLNAAAWKHQHLDWLSAMDLVGQQPFLLALEGETPVGCLACPPDLPDVAWLRLFAVAPGFSLTRAWERLWAGALALTRSRGAALAAALPVIDWLPPLLERSGFERRSAVVFLEWRGRTPPPGRPCPAVIRSMRPADLRAIAAVDQYAFGPLWRLSERSLAAALAQAQVASVAVVDGRLVGYQISTASALGAHLARLAVGPEAQGEGVGRALVIDALHALVQRGFAKVTVNTQTDNAPSLQLYSGLGFLRTEQEYPVYQMEVARSEQPSGGISQ